MGLGTPRLHLTFGLIFSALATFLLLAWFGTTVQASGAPGIPINDNYVTPYGTTLIVEAPGILANDIDPESDPLSVILRPGDPGFAVDDPSGSFVFTPAPGQTGTASFQYRVYDGTTISPSATQATVTVTIGNQPVAAPGSFITDEDQSNTGVLFGAVLGGTIDHYEIITSPASGNAELTDPATGAFQYTPNDDFAGEDSFTFVACASAASTSCSEPATVSITVNAVNDAPVATDDTYTSNEDETLTIAAPGVLDNDTDVDGNTLNATLVSDVSNGTLTLSANGGFEYTPDANFNGADSFTYVANDGGFDSNTATVTITVNAVNDAPVAVNDSYVVQEDIVAVVIAPGVLFNDTDPESDPLTASLATDVSSGILTLNADGSFTYTPNQGFSGEDSFTYVANDGTVDSNTATVTITVMPVNDPPSASDDAYSVGEDTTLNVDAPGVLENDTDADGNTLNASIATGPANGSVTLNPDGSFTYTPAANFDGTDSFTYVADDGMADSNTATVTITVNGSNDAPILISVPSPTTTEDTPVTDQIVASDPEGGSLSYTVQFSTAVATANGDVSITSDGTFTYTPNEGFVGQDSFGFQVCDDGDPSACTEGTVTVTVEAAASSPTPGPTVPVTTVTPEPTVPGETPEPTEPANGTPIVTVTPDPIDPTQAPGGVNPPSRPNAPAPVTSLPNTGAGQSGSETAILLILALACIVTISGVSLIHRRRQS